MVYLHVIPRSSNCDFASLNSLDTRTSASNAKETPLNIPGQHTQLILWQRFNEVLIYSLPLV